MSRTNRRKGHSFERDTAIKFREVGFKGARRQLEYHIDDCKGIDIAGTGPYKVQCKKTKTYVSINTINEIQCDREFGDVPILVAAGDGLEAMAVLPFKDLLKLLGKIHCK